MFAEQNKKLYFSAYLALWELWFGQRDGRNYSKASLSRLRRWWRFSNTKSKSKLSSLELGKRWVNVASLCCVKSWRQHPTRHQIYGHLPPITKTIQVRRTRHAWHCWRSRDELISDVLLWTPTYGRAKAGRPARTYIQQLCEDTGCSPEDLPEAMNDREKWRERVKDIRASGTWWWWWWWLVKKEFTFLKRPMLTYPR